VSPAAKPRPRSRPGGGGRGRGKGRRSALRWPCAGCSALAEGAPARGLAAAAARRAAAEWTARGRAGNGAPAGAPAPSPYAAAGRPPWRRAFGGSAGAGETPGVDVPRSDALPEGLEYRDTGCDLAPACLSCPLPVCVEEIPRGRAGLAQMMRDMAILELRARGVGVSAIAERLGVSRRTVFRATARLTGRQGGAWREWLRGR
jgi:hypothetical protein